MELIAKNEILFLIRAYNEGTRIGSVIKEIQSAGFNKILVVNDGSKDNTLSVLDSLDGITVISHPFNRGGGAALATGFEFVKRYSEEIGVKYVVTFDADGQHNIGDISNFIERMQEGKYDIILGSRFIQEKDFYIPLHRRITLFGGKIFTWMLSGVKLTDSHNGYRMLSVEAINKIKLTMDGFEYASELIEQIRIHNLRFTEVPVNILYDDYTLSKGQKSSNAIRIVWKMLWSKFLK